MCMKKLLEQGIQKYGTLSQLHREIVKLGYDISESMLRAIIKNEERGDKQRQTYSALNRLVFNGDWKKTGKLIDED